MSHMTIGRAAEKAGVHRTTINRAIKSGKLSVTTMANGERAVDASELERAYPSERPSVSERSGRSVHQSESEAMRGRDARIRLLERELEAYREREAKHLDLLAKQMLLITDQSRHTVSAPILTKEVAEELPTPLLKTVLATPAPAQEPPADRPPAIKKGSREWKKLKKRRKKLRDKYPNSPDLIEIEQIFKNIKKTNPKR